MIEIKRMLTKEEINKLIDEGDLSLKVTKPLITEKSSPVWKDFNHIYVSDVKQEYVICNHCEALLIYKPSSGTNSLSKHTRYCQETKKIVPGTGNQTSITRFYAASKSIPTVSRRLKQEIHVACAEFAALDYRPFNIVKGIGFKNLAQKIFNAGRQFAVPRETNIEDLLPHPTTVIDAFIDLPFV